MRKIRKLIVHCSATRPDMHPDWPAKRWVQEIDRWHRQRGWSGIGYHYVIARDGTVAVGRPENRVGAHVRGHNRDSIGICLIGGHGSTAYDAFSEHFTQEQDAALRMLLKQLKRKYPEARIYGHNEFAAKACPGFQVRRWWNRMTPARTSMAQSTTIQAASIAGIAQAGGAYLASISGLSERAQIVALVMAGIGLLAIAWIMRERIRKWLGGYR